jgi:hypothetical protein
MTQELCLREDMKHRHWFIRLQKVIIGIGCRPFAFAFYAEIAYVNCRNMDVQVMLMTPPSYPKKGYGPLRLLLSPFFRYFGQVMLMICDVLMIYRMISVHSYHITVSIMCPVFHFGVLTITWNCDAALKDLKSGMIDVPITRAALFRKVQTALAVADIVVILSMVVLFVVWTPLNQAEEGTLLFNLSSLHRLWLTDVMLMYKNLAFASLYSLGMMTLGLIWVGILLSYINGVFVAWSRLRDCRDLVIKLKDRVSTISEANVDSTLANRRSSMDDEEDEIFLVLLSKLVGAVNDCLSIRSGMTAIIRVGFVSAIFDVMLLTLFLVFSLLIISCSSICKTYGTDAYEQMLISGAKPCVYSVDNAVLVFDTLMAE